MDGALRLEFDWSMKPNRTIAFIHLIRVVRYFQSCLFGFAALCLASCSSNHRLGSSESPTGTYRLVSVDGAKVPTTVTHGKVNLEVRSGAFTINSDGTCGSKMIFVPPNGKEVCREVKATYTQAGSKLTMRWERAGMTIGQVEDQTFTMNNEGMVFIYEKDSKN